MARHEQAARVGPVGAGVPVEPLDRAQHLQGDGLQAGRRRQIVVQHRDTDAARHEGRGHPGEMVLVQAAPVAAVDEHQQRRIGFGRGKEVQALARAASVGEVIPPDRRFSGRLRAAAPTRQDVGDFRNHRPVVVLAIAEGFGEYRHFAPWDRKRAAQVASPGKG